MALTATRRQQGPPTSCHQCSEGPIYGFDVVDTDHGIHRVLCADCAREAISGAAADAAIHGAQPPTTLPHTRSPHHDR